MALLCIALLVVPLVAGNAITAAPELRRDLLRRQSTSASGLFAQSCGPWENIENSCAAANPSYTLLTAFVSQAPCLCYSSSTWAPNIYDDALATCLSYLSTASPAFYTSIDGPNLPRTPCDEVSSVVGPGASGITSGPTAAPTGDPNYDACLSWQSISSTCQASIPAFASLPIPTEDKCLCYTSGTYAPSIFDGYWASCLAYFSTASPTFYSSSLGGDGSPRSPCALYPPTVTGSTSTSGIASSSSGGSGVTATTGAVVTTSAPSSTIPLTTTVATTTASGSGAAGSISGVSLIQLLVPVLLLVVFQH
jgi:hypothetical protein